MEIKLNDEQRKQLLEDCYIKVVLDENNWLHAESCDDERWQFSYGEIGHKTGERYDGYCFDTKDLRKSKPERQSHNSFRYGNLCNNCLTPLTLHYPYCPMCGQKQDWTEG